MIFDSINEQTFISESKSSLCIKKHILIRFLMQDDTDLEGYNSPVPMMYI